MAVITDISVREFEGEPAQWDEFVGSMPSARFSHQHAWMQLVKDVYGGEPHYLAAHSGAKLVGVLPVMLRRVIGAGRVLISVPMADEAGVLAASVEADTALVDAACELTRAKGATYCELRQRHEPSVDMQADLSRLTLEMALPPDADQLWDGLNGKVRNQVRKAQKSGLQVSPTTDPQFAISAEFYPVYSENTRDLGSPMHSVRFFQQVAERFPNSACVLSVGDEKTIVGSALALKWRDTFMVPWASSLRRYFSMCPNNLLYWELMRLAIEQGCRLFDFGRSPRDAGTYRFKKAWGADPIQLYDCYHYVSGNSHAGEKRDSLSYRAFSSAWPKVPLPLARAIGPKIFARLPI